MRIEIFYREHGIDGRALKTLKALRTNVSTKIKDVFIADVYMTDCAELNAAHAADIFSDKVAQRCKIDEPAVNANLLPDWNFIVEIAYKAGVNDPVATTARKAIENNLGVKLSEATIVQTAQQFIIKSDELTQLETKKLLGLLHNNLIQRAHYISKASWDKGERMEALYSNKVAESKIEVETIQVKGLTDTQLAELSRKRLLALSPEEMNSIQEYYSRPEIIAKRNESGLPAEPTDVELEMIAQTWSEHCKHKILNARINYKDLEKGTEEKIKSLFKEYVKKTTDDLTPSKPFLRSVFVDDSGIIEFDKDHLVCFKVETHNSPSALDPFGGAITGIVGVNRDIMGSGKSARPIFNTNVLCFGDPDTDPKSIPEELLHPREVMHGVHHGIIDGGNQSGIPVVGGAFVFDDSYVGKPLVFCGTGGILPASVGGEGAWIKHINPGDLAVMIGGRIGKDGIHGATFSSLVLDEESPTSAVQIGDPITQKKFNDFLQEARDKQLFHGITDNGAGGLSSSMGEMAESSGGLNVDLKKAPLKYVGLAPWEIWVSESQERMSLAVPPKDIDAFMALAKKRDVEATVIGEFTNSGNIELFYGDKPVCQLELDFIHDGLPPMQLEAEWKAPSRPITPIKNENSDLTSTLLDILADPTVASKEPLVRQYDHEVQAQSVIKPFVGVNSDAPSDGAVIKPVATSDRGLTVTHGICQRYSDIDAYQMAANAVDEAFRAHIALGGDPEFASVLDNICWPDPVESDYTPDGKYKLAQLVRCCKGFQDTCMVYGLPFISGKDSMKNDSKFGDKKVSVRPTLLISLMGVTQDIKKAQSTDFKSVGDLIYIVGDTRDELGATTYEKVTQSVCEHIPTVFPETAFEMYKKFSKAIHADLMTSCHDLADGGLAVSLAESALGGQMGAEIDLNAVSEELSATSILFSESPSRFIATVSPDKQAAFEAALAGSSFNLIGQTVPEPVLKASLNGQAVLNADLVSIEKAWKRFEN